MDPGEAAGGNKPVQQDAGLYAGAPQSNDPPTGTRGLRTSTATMLALLLVLAIVSVVRAL